MSNTTLNTNVNVMKARAMLGTVSGATCVDSSLLLEDDGFCTLLTKLSHTVSLNEGIEALTEYVNNNY
jgi:hypothetical protein